MRVLFCGGGTGGHVYPALAVAREFRSGDTPTEHEIRYVGAEGEIEEQLVPQAGVALETIPGGGLHGVGLARLVRNLPRLVRGLARAWRIVGRFRPDVVFLTGGYVSVPVALAAWLRRRPILVYLPDVEPGLAIKLLSRIATRVAVTVEASRQYLPPDKVEVTGYPLRPEFYQVEPPLRQSARARFGIAPEDKVLLVFGGSRGARTINRALGAILERVLVQAHVIHISGSVDAEACQMRRDILPPAAQARYHLFDYVHEMALALAAADLVVARAGAATLAEFPFFGLPAILVPYPYAWRYQKVNADYVTGRGAAIRLNDEDMRQQLWPTIQALFEDDERLKRMSDSARALSRPGATARLADLVIHLAHGSRLEREEADYGRH
jgi:UDP-N-acetylglucosamine--N-acetylmuramyl-(pentapeptide) pyrophosphoryl-undecaprenol N-acetylglucosamine transferase